MKVFQKRVTKKRHQDALGAPEIQYMDIYKQTVKRLSVFAQVELEESDEDIFYGDVSEYERRMETSLKHLNQQEAQSAVFEQAQLTSQYMASFRPASLMMDLA